MKFRDVRRGEFPEKVDFPIVCVFAYGPDAFLARSEYIGPLGYEFGTWVNDKADREGETGAMPCRLFPIWIPVSELYAEVMSGK